MQTAYTLYKATRIERGTYAAISVLIGTALVAQFHYNILLLIALFTFVRLKISTLYFVGLGYIQAL